MRLMKIITELMENRCTGVEETPSNLKSDFCFLCVVEIIVEEDNRVYAVRVQGDFFEDFPGLEDGNYVFFTCNINSYYTRGRALSSVIHLSIKESETSVIFDFEEEQLSFTANT
ncbi:unnamed protein product [Vicia faba]|uniref:Uncharacterized protein n=1 Tax=Vicia faba TaxID=3906 RepID=A0AAV1B8P9_VICFA|nr:unnamed protein product [Vicia faba]